MNLRLAQTIQKLDEDRLVIVNKLDEYRDLQKDLSSESAQEIQYVIEHFRVLERSILKALSALKADSMRTPQGRVF